MFSLQGLAAFILLAVSVTARVPTYVFLSCWIKCLLLSMYLALKVNFYWSQVLAAARILLFKTHPCDSNDDKSIQPNAWQLRRIPMERLLLYSPALIPPISNGSSQEGRFKPIKTNAWTWQAATMQTAQNFRYGPVLLAVPTNSFRIL